MNFRKLQASDGETTHQLESDDEQQNALLDDNLAAGHCGLQFFYPTKLGELRNYKQIYTLRYYVHHESLNDNCNGKRQIKYFLLHKSFGIFHSLIFISIYFHFRLRLRSKLCGILINKGLIDQLISTARFLQVLLLRSSRFI